MIKMVVYKNKKAFSFVEIIITISIIALLAVVGFTVSNNYQDKTNNSKITADIETITNSLESYKQETKALPLPMGNNNYFKEDASYAHSGSADIFGVHGYITEGTLPKRYLDALPLDPKTNQYYAYGKLMNGKEYELSGINWVNGEPEAFVRGNYAAEVGPYNLIREYNGPDFVYDKSESNFPYNPDERVLVAKIHDYNGSVIINETITDTGAILAYTLGEGDKIVVKKGGYAEIYFSDGSSSTLGDTDRDSELILSKMVFKKENNLFTNIKLTLGAGTIWSKATTLDEDSDFEIYTTDATAAVRGTIFGLKKVPGSDTNITVKEGKVNIETVSGITSTEVLSQEVKAETVTKNFISASTLSSVISLSFNDESYIEVVSGGIEKGADISGYGGLSISSSIGAMSTIPPEIKNETLNLYGKITNTLQPQLESFTYTTNTDYQIDIKLNDILRNKAEFITINGDRIYNNWESNTGGLILTPTTPLEINQALSLLTDGADDLKLAFGYTKVDGTEVYTKTLIIPLIEATYSSSTLTIPCSTFNVGPSGDECAEEDSGLAADGWELVAYAPYNEEGDFDMYKKGGGELKSFPEYLSIEGGGLMIDKNLFDGGVDSLKYEDLNLDDDDDYVIELSVEKNALEQTGGRYIFDNENNNGLYILKTISEHVIIYKGDPVYSGPFLTLTAPFEQIIINNTLQNNTLQIGGQTFPIDSIDIDDLYIGSKNISILQLNGVINYVKIYTPK